MAGIRCPYCRHDQTQSYHTKDRSLTADVRRRRRCLSCNGRFATIERLEESPELSGEDSQAATAAVMRIAREAARDEVRAALQRAFGRKEEPNDEPAEAS